MANPPQQGDSNLGWGGEHQWGRSWRDRPPPARPPPAGAHFSPILDQKMAKSRFSGRVSIFFRDPSQWIWGPRGPRGPWGPCWGVPVRAVYTGIDYTRTLDFALKGS